MDIIKNPAVIGLGGSVATYFYLEWKNKKKLEKDKNEGKTKHMVNNLIISLIIGLIIWFVIYCWLEFNKSKLPNVNMNSVINLPDRPMFIKDTLSSDDIVPVNIPSKPIPEILIDMV